MKERFDHLEQRFDRLEETVSKMFSEVRQGFREVAGLQHASNARIDANSRQIAGLSRRIDSLTRHQQKFASDVVKRLDRVDAKAQITIEGHEAIRSEMHREFATLRRDLDLRVQPIEVAVKKGRSA